MKQLNQFIQEKLVINKHIKITKYKCFPETKEELIEDIQQHFQHNQYNLNDIDVSKLTDLSDLKLHKYINTKNYDLDVSEWDVSNVTNMFGLFALLDMKTIDISGWNTRNVENMSSMFSGCERLTEIKGLEELDVSYVTDMSFMFYDTMSLKSIDLSQWDTRSLKNIDHIFERTSAKKINVTNFNLSNVRFLDNTFRQCDKLTNIIGLDTLDTSNIQTLNGTFAGASKLKTINLSSWNTKKLEQIINTFSSCLNLVDIGDISNWDISSLTYLNSTFENCPNLELDIKKWNVLKNDKIEKYNVRRGSKKIKL